MSAPAIDGPPEADDVVPTIWRFVYARKPARALALTKTLRAWFVECDTANRGAVPTAAHYRTFLHGVELLLEAQAEARSDRRERRRLGLK